MNTNVVSRWGKEPERLYSGWNMKVSVLLVFVSVSMCLLVLVSRSVATAEDKSVLRGRVADVEGNSVEGVRVFLYDSPDVRRPADFISAGTTKEGLFRMAVPSGKYWATARLKKAEGFGPLMPGDKHSGEPLEIALAPGAEVSMDFVVADLREAAATRSKEKGSLVRITGRIIDEKGLPLARAYAFANRTERISGIPDYLSAWDDNEGRYTLYVPKGKYFVGAASTFPPDKDFYMKGEMTVDSDKSNVDITSKTRENK